MLITRPSDLPRDLYGSLEAKKIDALAPAFYRLSGYDLMSKAGHAAFALIQQHWPQVKSLDIVCGTGNNGGDGFALARIAKEKGWQVTVHQVGKVNEAKLPLEAKTARLAWLATQGKINPFGSELFKADLIVDALLGLGIHGPLSEDMQTAISTINQSVQPVLALDLPSGLNADTGCTEGQCIQADVTLTYMVMKIGLLSANGIEQVGQLALDNLDIEDDLLTQVNPIARRLVYEEIITCLPKRRLVSHKGDNGHVCVVGGGESGLSGAVCLAGEAALRAGAGLVSAVVAPESLPLLARAPAELMSYALKTPKALPAILARATVIVLGSGLGKTKWSARFFQAAVQSMQTKVIDADGLNWLAQFPQKQQNWILTPHPKEAAQLLGISTEAIQQDRHSAVKQLQEKYGGVIVLKGAGTLIFDQENNCYLNQGGYPGLATGGTGDILAGLIGGLLAQGLSLADAAKLGVNLQTNAAQSLSERGMLASDLLLPIRDLLNPSNGRTAL